MRTVSPLSQECFLLPPSLPLCLYVNETMYILHFFQNSLLSPTPPPPLLHTHTQTHRGADITALDEDSYTPLLTAAAHGQAGALKKLLDRGAPVDDLDKDGKSVVFVAAEEDHTDVLQVSREPL